MMTPEQMAEARAALTSMAGQHSRWMRAYALPLLEAVEAMQGRQPDWRFHIGSTVCKKSGSEWHGTVVGTYTSSLTDEGYAVESWTEKGSVQIYPASALEAWTPPKDIDNER